MKLLTISAITIASIIAFKLIRFFARGGTLTQPAINTTHLYYQIRKIYGNMEPGCAAYIAMIINSTSARNTMTKRMLTKLASGVKSDGDWPQACSSYTLMWHRYVANATILDRMEEYARAHNKIKIAIDKAKNEMLLGSRRFEQWVRNIPLYSVMEMTLEYLDCKMEQSL